MGAPIWVPSGLRSGRLVRDNAVPLPLSFSIHDHGRSHMGPIWPAVWALSLRSRTLMLPHPRPPMLPWVSSGLRSYKGRHVAITPFFHFFYNFGSPLGLKNGSKKKSAKNIKSRLIVLAKRLTVSSNRLAVSRLNVYIDWFYSYMYMCFLYTYIYLLFIY